MNTLENVIKKFPFLYKPLLAANFMRNVSFRKITGARKRLPTVVQLPVTYNCNSKCIMCNIWQMDYSNEMNLEEFKGFMSDPVFSKVEAVGINGGEPTLVKGLDEFAVEILKLPKIKALNIISHGFNKKQLFPFLEATYQNCKKQGVRFHVSISLDGFGEVHNTARGLKVFDIVAQSIHEIHNNMAKYCDSFDIGCTVIRQNADFLGELNAFSRKHGYEIKYRLGISNKRIESDKLMDQFSVLDDQGIQSSREYFHYLSYQAKNLREQFKYFAIYYFLTAQKKRRLLGCHWKENGITMDSRGDLYYCAVASEKIGSLREGKGTDIFLSDENIKYRQTIIDHDCNNCIHDYSGKPEWPNVVTFFKELWKEKYYWLNYYLKARLS